MTRYVKTTTEHLVDDEVVVRSVTLVEETDSEDEDYEPSSSEEESEEEESEEEEDEEELEVEIMIDDLDDLLTRYCRLKRMNMGRRQVQNC